MSLFKKRKKITLKQITHDAYIVDISVILTPCSGHVDPPHRFWFKEQVT